MPPKAKINKELILAAAFNIAKNEGIDSVNARAISKALGCSTQPVMYYFKTVNEIKEAVYEMANDYHTEFLVNPSTDEAQSELETNPSSQMSLNYIRFAAQEPNLFKFLFQTDHFSHQSLDDLINDDNLAPVLEVMSNALGTDIEKTKKLFTARFLMVHGMASMLANNAMVYDEPRLLSILNETFC